MSDVKGVRRVVVCVDGVSPAQSNRSADELNATTISRFKSLVAEGPTRDAYSRYVVQSVLYYSTSATDVGAIEKLKSRIGGEQIEDQIKQVTKDVCEALQSPEDEVYFYGYGRGAFVVRAVAGVLHHMGLPSRSAMDEFDAVYQAGVDLYRARVEDDSKKGPKLLEFIQSRCEEPPQIAFMGLFDTIKFSPKTMYDISFVPSIRNLRQALALNESRSGLSPEFIENPSKEEMNGRSFIQAWFIGTHQDLGGGGQHDGLSLYPLQWMILESMKSGLLLDPGHEHSTAPVDNPLSLTFPHFAGGLPVLGGAEKIEWQLQYTNGIQISMFDLASVTHRVEIDKKTTHSIRLEQDMRLYNSYRKVFVNKELRGWTTEGGYGTIIHPSLYCLLDRTPQIQEHPRSKALKQEFGQFQDQCMIQSDFDVPPWLDGMELQASGVKAFRILVCGKTGVGKSTLINKVFGVEMTEESKSYTQGVHDINKAFESPNNPGLLIHDSRGWQAGSDAELELIAKFLRHRAFQKDSAEALHVIWFCLDADVSRVEEADRRTFQTIAQYSHQVPVFVIGTKKDKLTAIHKGELLDQYMQKTNDYQESSRLAKIEAERMAEEQFADLRNHLSQIKHYKADGYCCLSKDDDQGVKDLVNQTLGLITDERVRLFCVAAQVIDVDQKIDSAITECMRLGVHAIRTAIVPLPASGIIGTPTVSRLICEHVLQCFGFPKAAPEEVEDIMSRVVLGNLKEFMGVSIAQMLVVGAATAGLIVGTMGAGAVLGGVGCLIAAPPAARMLLKCSCDMILILERSFRYGGRFVSAKQIEDAAKYYTTATRKTFAGKDKLLQKHVHDEINDLVPLKKISVGLRFTKMRADLARIIYENRFDQIDNPNSAISPLSSRRVELDSTNREIKELDGTDVKELDGHATALSELEGDPSSPRSTRGTLTGSRSTITDSSTQSRDWKSSTTITSVSEDDSLNPTTTKSSTSISHPPVPELQGSQPGQKTNTTSLARGKSDVTATETLKDGKWRRLASLRFGGGLKKSKTTAGN